MPTHFRYAFLKSGVGLIDIADKEFFQIDLFCDGQNAKTDSLMALLDKVNKKYGKGTVYMAAEGIQKNWLCNRIIDQRALRLAGQVFR